MRYCKKCLYPDTKPQIIFNDEGICSACINHDKKEIIDWDKKRQEFQEILDKYKSRNKTNYDCIIPVSGGKDSTRQALWIRDKLKLRPLLVCCTYPPEQLTELGAQNLSNLISLGFDLIVTSPGPITWKKFLKKP